MLKKLSATPSGTLLNDVIAFVVALVALLKALGVL